MEKDITIKPIGIIHTPYKNQSGIPIQARFGNDAEGYLEIFEEYAQGLKDIEGFSHLFLIYYFNQATEEKLIGKPFLEDEPHGIFAIRSPMRPNHIGISIVKVTKIEHNKITFCDVDILDNTPLLDIKPYISHFDVRDNVKNGWIEKHFANGNIPKRTKIA